MFEVSKRIWSTKIEENESTKKELIETFKILVGVTSNNERSKDTLPCLIKVKV